MATAMQCYGIIGTIGAFADYYVLYCYLVHYVFDKIRIALQYWTLGGNADILRYVPKISDIFSNDHQTCVIFENVR